MLTINLDSAIFLYLGLLLGTVLPVWVLVGRQSSRKRHEIRIKREIHNMRTCELCLFEYIDSNHSEMSRCPQCDNLNESLVSKAERTQTHD